MSVEETRKIIITIGICVKNGEDLIKDAIDSIRNQDFPHERMEVIFVDDGSEDRTLSVILDSVSRMDMQVKVYHTEWRGLGPARNTVVDNASGNYIIWVDSDMTMPRDYVRKQVEFMDRNPSAGIVGGMFKQRSGNSLVSMLEIMMHRACAVVYGRRTTSKSKERVKLLGTAGSIYRVEAIRQVGGFDDSIKRAGEDKDAAHRIGAVGWLLCQSQAIFYERCRESWKALWYQYFRYGYGNHYMFHNIKGYAFPLYRKLPPAGFIEGLLLSFVAYKLTGRKAVFLLPLQFVFKTTAWCFGFATGHIYGDGHRSRSEILNRKWESETPIFYSLNCIS